MTTKHEMWTRDGANFGASHEVDASGLRKSARDLVRSASGAADAHITSAISETLAQLCENNSHAVVFPETWQPASLFFSKTKQSFSIDWYLKRLYKHADCSRSAFIVALIYLGRVQDAGGHHFLTVEMNVHRLYLTALVLATKFLDEPVYDNMHYARVGGVGTLEEMNALELEMLRILDFRLFVEPESYEGFKKILLEMR